MARANNKWHLPHCGGEGTCRDCGEETDLDGVCRVPEIRNAALLARLNCDGQDIPEWITAKTADARNKGG